MFFELVGNTAIDLPLDLQNELLKARQSFAHVKTNDYYNLGYDNTLQLPILAKSDFFGTKEYFCDNKMDYVSQIQIFPLSAKTLNIKPRFTPRAIMVTHLTTHKNRESNDYLCQAKRFEALFRSTSDDFVPSVERSNSSTNQVRHEETLMIDTAPRSQSDSSYTPSNHYQGSSTPVASSNRQ